MPEQNRQITLAARPQGYPKESDFRLVVTPVPEPAEGECLVQGLYLSVDPYMRGRMREAASYAPPVPIGGVMAGGVVGRVIETRHEKFKKGDLVVGDLGWQEYAVAPGDQLHKADPHAAPVPTALGVLGMPGLTAYFGFLDICDPQPGETVVVSGAAGAVGSTVGQIAKIKGCRAAGVAGSDEKIRWITEDLGFDAGFNYKTVNDYAGRLKQLCPDGIDCYFDNVGGPVTDAVFELLNEKARVAVCGQISQYNQEKFDPGPPLWRYIIKRLKVQGFLVFDYADRYQEGLNQLTSWVQSGRLKYRHNIAEGIENAPKAFIGMLKGENIGKQLVKLAG